MCRRVGGGVRRVRTNPLWSSIMADWNTNDYNWQPQRRLFLKNRKLNTIILLPGALYSRVCSIIYLFSVKYCINSERKKKKRFQSICKSAVKSSLKACDPDDFPNLYMLLKIAATLPVTTCECERSISTMRRLNNYMRCTMGESRLSSLALMHIKYDMPVNLEEIVNLFEGLHPKMMQFASLLHE